MSSKKILFISGSAGLGHVTRDLAIANELHKQNPEIELSWLAADPALLPASGDVISRSPAAPPVSSLMRMILAAGLICAGLCLLAWQVGGIVRSRAGSASEPA